MATRVELPIKREFQADSGEEAAASKKAKATEESSPNDEVMADGSSEQEEAIPEDDDDTTSESSAYESDEEEALGRQAINDRFTSMTNQVFLPDIDLTREYQLFLHLQGDAERASQIACEKDAHDVLSEAEMSKFWASYKGKRSHIRRQTSDNLSDYQCLAFYRSTSEDDPFYQTYARYCYLDYKFDTLYMKVADELRKCETIEWDTSYADISRIAEAICEKHMSSDVQSELPLDVWAELIEELVLSALGVSKIRQEIKELVPLYVDLCQREVKTEEDFVREIKKIFVDQKVGDAFVYSEDLVNEALQVQEGQSHSRLWYKYYYTMTSLGNLQTRQAALSDSELKDLITNYLERDSESEFGCEYIDYVKMKINKR